MENAPNGLWVAAKRTRNTEKCIQYRQMVVTSIYLITPKIYDADALEMNTLASYDYSVLGESHHLYHKGKIWYCYQSSVNLFGVKEALFGHESIRMLCVELVPDLLYLLLRHLVLPHHYPHLQKIQHYHIIVVINIFIIFQAPLLWAEAQKPSWHCHPGGFCASGKFLHVTLEIALGSLHIVWKVSKLSGKFPDGLGSFLLVWVFSGWFGNFLDNLKTFWIVWIFFGWSGKLPDSLERLQIVWIFSGCSVKFPDSLENFKIAWKVSG